MLTIVIPTLNAQDTLAPALSALVPGVLAGLVKQLVIADGGSEDATLAIAEAAGADVVKAEKGRGSQLAAGAALARGDWLMFLHADTLLEPGWEQEVRQFIEEASAAGDLERAAAFRYRLNDRRTAARIVERAVALRCLLLGLPYGDQGLILSRPLYRRVGGFRPMPLMEDVDIVRRIGRRRVSLLRHAAVTSAERYRRDGFLLRPLRNLACLALYFLGVRPQTLARLYG